MSFPQTADDDSVTVATFEQLIVPSARKQTPRLVQPLSTGSEQGLRPNNCDSSSTSYFLLLLKFLFAIGEIRRFVMKAAADCCDNSHIKTDTAKSIIAVEVCFYGLVPSTRQGVRSSSGFFDDGS